MLTALRSVLLVPPGWLPRVGSVLPTLFADFTTEGTTNHYWYNGAQYGSEAAWFTAISGTFSRASTASYTTSAGLLNTTSATSGVLRFDYDPVALTPKGILLEGASTNKVLNSGNALLWLTLDNATRAGGVSDPTGGTAGVTITASAGAGFHDIRSGAISSLTNGSTITHSVFVKQGTAPFVWFGDFSQANFPAVTLKWSDMSISSSGQQSATGAVSSTNWAGWYRLSLTFVLNTTSANPTIGPCTVTAASLGDNGPSYVAAGTETIIIWGMQGVESLTFASSYIPTVAVAVTRAADALSMPLVAASTLTAVAKVTSMAGFVSAARLLGVGSGKFINQSDSTHAQTDNGTNTLSTAVTNWTGANKIGVAGDGSGRAIAANGNAAATDANALLAGAITNFYLMSDNGSGLSYGDLASIAAWNGTKATGAQLTTLTT